MAFLNWHYQALARFHSLEYDQGPKPVIHRFLQVLLAAEIALSCQNGGVPQEELDLFKFSLV